MIAVQDALNLTWAIAGAIPNPIIAAVGSVVVSDASVVKRDAGVVVDASKPDVAIKDAAPDVPCTDLPVPPPQDAGWNCDWSVPLPCGIAPMSIAMRNPSPVLYGTPCTCTMSQPGPR